MNTTGIFELEKTFSDEVEIRVRTQKEVSYIDAIMDLCDMHGVDPEAVARFLTKPIREKLLEEGQARNIIPKTTVNLEDFF